MAKADGRRKHLKPDKSVRDSAQVCELDGSSYKSMDCISNIVILDD